MTLDQRIEAAARALASRYSTEAEWPDWVETAKDTVRAAFPELFSDPPTMWLAPMEASEEMSLSALRAVSDFWPDRAHFQGEAELAFIAMRDAHLQSQEGKG